MEKHCNTYCAFLKLLRRVIQVLAFRKMGTEYMWRIKRLPRPGRLTARRVSPELQERMPVLSRPVPGAVEGAQRETPAERSGAARGEVRSPARFAGEGPTAVTPSRLREGCAPGGQRPAAQRFTASDRDGDRRGGALRG
jgi:hypothetical protein